MIWGAYEIKTARNNNVRNIFNAKYNQITVFGINSMSKAVRKCEIVRDKAECYFTLPDCIASAINPKYHSMDHPITN